MHVVTFYSFKGGVGRSMALVNVAAHLAQSGRRVLMVDMDLEAPGLRSFRFGNPHPTTPGVVEYVSHYLDTDEVPDCRDFIYEAQTFPDTGGSLWIMPAGEQNETYEQRFAAINWQTLYSERDGYLLIENLRSQWEDALRPDYVLIDSRTGFTDVAGICTRQLPDAVCLVFTPNPQNLFGLKQICSAINTQKNFPSLRQPHVHFVASNVPNLDDENEVLSKIFETFSRELGYKRLTSTIHYYNSLALIEQSPFVLGHPNSRLTRQYIDLATEIAKHNPEDKQSALRFLQSVVKELPEGRRGVEAQQVEDRIVKILSRLGQDNEVLFWVSRVYRSTGKWDECRVLLERVISDGYKDSRALLDLASLKIQGTQSDQDCAINDLIDFLNLEEPAPVSNVSYAIQLLVEHKKDAIQHIAESKAISSLSAEDVTFVVNQLNKTRSSATLRRLILERTLDRRDLTEGNRRDLTGALCISLISLGQLRAAVEQFEAVIHFPHDADVVKAFNFGFSLFWLDDQRYCDYLRQFLSLTPTDYEGLDLNYLQCISFANWAVGDVDQARKVLARAKALAHSRFHAFTFSCWRYLEVLQATFIDDLNALSELYAGHARTPVFLEPTLG